MAIFPSEISPARVAEVWKQLPPPTRPSQAALEVYKQHLRQAKARGEDSVLVLGATPELRLLALREGFDVVFVDRDRLMIEAMALLMDYLGVDKTHERCLRYDWIKIPDYQPPFGVVLGDGSLNHLTREQMSKLLSKMRGLLTASASLCLRVMTYPQSRTQASLVNIFSRYRTQAAVEQNEMLRDLWMKLLFAKGVYRKPTRTASLLRLSNELKRAHHSKHISDEEFGTFAPLAGAFAWGSPTVPFRGEFRRMLDARFRIKRIHELERREHLDVSRIYELDQVVPK